MTLSFDHQWRKFQKEKFSSSRHQRFIIDKLLNMIKENARWRWDKILHHIFALSFFCSFSRREKTESVEKRKMRKREEIETQVVSCQLFDKQHRWRSLRLVNHPFYRFVSFFCYANKRKSSITKIINELPLYQEH